MELFELFLESQEKDYVKRMIAKLPENHQKLLNGYEFKYTCGTTLNNDKTHIGYIYKNKIVVCSPWHYGREFCTLHEIAHLIWEAILTKKQKEEWEKLFNETIKEQIKLTKNKKSLNQDAEEIFAMSYANFYAEHKNFTYYNEKWMKFIDSIFNRK